MPKLTVRRSGSTDDVAIPVTDSVFSDGWVDVVWAFASGYNAPKETDTERITNMAIVSCFDFFILSITDM